MQAEQQQPTGTDLNGFSLLPIMQAHPELIAGIKAQLPQYMAKVTGLKPVDGIFEWWRGAYDSGNIPSWVELARCVLILRPHAAGHGPECIFSRVRQTFGETQPGPMEDEIEGAMMSQVNRQHSVI